MPRKFNELMENPHFKEELKAAFEAEQKKEEERFKDGCCPDCGGKLYRYAQSYFRGQFGYTFPICEKCKTEFQIIWGKMTLVAIPKTGEKDFLELLNRPFTI